jgi:hypothetical protein
VDVSFASFLCAKEKEGKKFCSFQRKIVLLPTANL